MNQKTILKTIIADFHKRELPTTKERAITIPENSGKIITLIGPRRAGKTHLLFQIMKNLPKKDILYINFEDDRLSLQKQDLQFILEAYYELYPNNTPTIFFDEIQNIQGWEQFVRRLYDTTTKNIYITGSSAKLLSKEIATALRGRSISYEVYPLSFKEYLSFKNITIDQNTTTGKAELTKELEEYLQQGGFPELINAQEQVREKTLHNYFEVMLYKDIIERHQSNNPQAIKELLKTTLQQTGKEFNTLKTYNDFKSRNIKIARETITQYLEHFQDAYILQIITNYSESIRKQTIKKIYAIDTGLAKRLSITLSKEQGRLLETAILIELKRREKEVYYYKENKECDFVIKEKDKITQAIQVCYELTKENEQREIQGLQQAMKKLNIQEGIIITLNQEDNKDNIKIIPATKWLTQ